MGHYVSDEQSIMCIQSVRLEELRGIAIYLGRGTVQDMGLPVTSLL
jgi:hypothetical protein